MKTKKIAFYGLFGQQNLGNDCTLDAIFNYVRMHIPEVGVICICTDPEVISARYDIAAFPISEPHSGWLSSDVWPMWDNPLMKLIKKILIRIPIEIICWIKAFWILSGTYMLIAPGTGLLTDYATHPFGRPYDIFKWSLIAKFCRCKLLFVSMGAGPIYEPLSKWFIKFALWLADYRSYRDSYSKQYMESIGSRTKNDPIYPDLAFSLPIAMMPKLSGGKKAIRVIGVGLKDYYGQRGIRQQDSEAFYRDYINKLGFFVTWLLEQKYTVRLLIGDVKYDGQVKRDLIEFLQRDGINSQDAPIIDEPIFSVEQLLSQLAATDLVVSPRFHNIILALMLNKPVVSLSYNAKFESLMTGLDLEKFCQNIGKLDIDKLIEQLMELEKNAGKMLPGIQHKTGEYRRALEAQYEFIFNDVRSD